MERCVLCNEMARAYCESDQACLCWDCDAKVHSANFLVARHSRNLLCCVCQFPMPWSASGAKLSPTVSVCVKCVNRTASVSVEEEDGINEESEDETDGDEEEGADLEENHVVPSSALPPPPPSPASSSSSEGSAIGERKRMLEEVSHEDHGCTSPPLATKEEVAEETSPPRKTRKQRADRLGLSESGNGIIGEISPGRNGFKRNGVLPGHQGR